MNKLDLFPELFTFEPYGKNENVSQKRFNPLNTKPTNGSNTLRVKKQCSDKIKTVKGSSAIKNA